MNKLYAYGLGATLLLGGVTATAQNRPAGPAYELGSPQTLVRQLESQVAADVARRQPKPRVTLRVAADKTFTGQVNYREDLASSGEYLIGELAGVPNSSFFVRVEGNQVEGNIVLRDTRQAYRYSADARGNAQVQEVDIDKVICIDYNKPLGYQYPAPPSSGTAQRAAVVSLQSLPGAKGCLYIDLDGEYVSGTPWNNGNPINAAPSGIENDAAKVQAFWELVSEDFRPFSLNVTTDLAVFNSYPKNMRMRCIVTPTNTAAPGAGGVAYLTSFRGNNDTPCWVFMNDPKAGGEATSHEIGHTLGLSHDGRVNPDEGYYTGQDNSGAWAPIMGAGYYKPVTQWSKGEYNRASQTQDDLAIMSGPDYNVGYRNDDHGNSTGTATVLARSGTSLSGKGIIERTSDQDYFSFTTGGGAVSFNVSTVGRYGNLDIVVRLFEGSGAQIGTFDAAGGGNLNVAFNASLGAGTYYLQIDGTSSGNPATDGYSDYASLGTFNITGTAPTGGTPPPAGGVATFYKDCSYAGTAVALPAGDYPLSALQGRGILNDDVSSLRVNAGFEVVLYENDNFTGASLTVGSAGNACLVNNPLGTANWNDKTTSLRVRTAASTAFSRLLEAEAANVNNGMSVEACSEGGQNMGYVDAGDYLVWNGISFPTSGSYLLEYRMASGASGGTISADLNAGTTQLGSTSVGGTGGWQNWTTVSRTVTVTAGTYNFGIYAQSGGWNLNWVRITKVDGAASAAASPDQVAAAGLAAPTELILYPNPVSDRLTLRAPTEFAGGQVRILNVVGQQVWQGTYDGQTVDVSALKSGVYTLLVTNEGRQKLVRRFSKQ